MTGQHCNNSISLLMPVKNEILNISRALSQMAENMIEGDEIVVVDDGSVDGTWKIIADYQAKNEGVVLLRNPGTGIVDALNFGVRSSKNQWIARFDADDYYPSNRLALQRREFKKNIGVVFSDYSFRSLSGKNLGEVKTAVTTKQTLISLISGQRTAHPSAIFSKSAFELAGGYRHSDFPAEDLSLWLRISQEFNLISVPYDLLSYTLRTGSITNLNQVDSQKKKRELLLTYTLKDSLISDFIQNFEKELQLIDAVPHSAERKLLFLRDIYLLKELQLFTRKTMFDFQKKILKNLAIEKHSYYVFLRLAYFWFRRKVYKLRIFPS
jgi:glycosyltransferase involved in cell wall biosynthesis